MNPSTAALSIQRIGLATSSTPTFRAAHGLGDVRKLHPRLTFTPPPFRLPPGMSPGDHTTESRLSHRGQRLPSTPGLDLRSPRDRTPGPDSHRCGRPLVATCREQHRSGRSRPTRPKGASTAESPPTPPARNRIHRQPDEAPARRDGAPGAAPDAVAPERAPRRGRGRGDHGPPAVPHPPSPFGACLSHPSGRCPASAARPPVGGDAEAGRAPGGDEPARDARTPAGAGRRPGRPAGHPHHLGVHDVTVPGARTATTAAPFGVPTRVALSLHPEVHEQIP